MSAWTTPLYTVKRLGPGAFTVAKFADGKRPDAVYEVTEAGPNDWWTDSPAYFRMGQQEKHIRLVKLWIREGEPDFTAYQIEGDEFPSFRFGSAE